MARQEESPLSRRSASPPRTGSAPPALDRKRLALVHIVKKELKLGDEDYRCILKRIAGNPAILAELNCPGPVSIPTQQTHVEAMVGIYHQVIGSYQHP